MAVYLLGYIPFLNTKAELVYSERYFNLKKQYLEFSKDKEQIASDPQFARGVELLQHAGFRCPGVLETELTSKQRRFYPLNLGPFTKKGDLLFLDLNTKYSIFSKRERCVYTYF
jgi:hypothetical protein